MSLEYSLQSLINWLLDPGGGGIVAVLVGLPILLEKIPSWAQVPKNFKIFIPLIVTVIAAIVAVVLRDNPDTVASMEKWFQPLAMTIYAWVSVELLHKATKAEKAA